MPDSFLPDTLFHIGNPSWNNALITPDGMYRYELTRRWGAGKVATFIMLNPSTADALLNDPTIVRCRNFARSWGCASLRVVNLYALRATNPKKLWHATDPVGPDNDQHLTRAAVEATEQGWPLVAAWGANAKADRVAHVLTLDGMTALTALGVTNMGQPRHPLYLRSTAVRQPWPPHVRPAA